MRFARYAVELFYRSRQMIARLIKLIAFAATGKLVDVHDVMTVA
jgi:hypothetical protein